MQFHNTSGDVQKSLPPTPSSLLEYTLPSFSLWCRKVNKTSLLGKASFIHIRRYFPHHIICIGAHSNFRLSLLPYSLLQRVIKYEHNTEVMYIISEPLVLLETHFKYKMFQLMMRNSFTKNQIFLMNKIVIDLELWITQS